MLVILLLLFTLLTIPNLPYNWKSIPHIFFTEANQPRGQLVREDRRPGPKLEMLKWRLILKDTVQCGDISSLTDSNLTAEAYWTVCICTCAKVRCMFMLIMNPYSLITLTCWSTAIEMPVWISETAATVSPCLRRLAGLSPLLLLTPGGYSRQYFHFSRPINVSRTRQLNGWSSVTSVCWQEGRLQHLIWPVSSFQDADVAQRQGAQGLSRPEGFTKHIGSRKKGGLYICQTADQVQMFLNGYG